MRPEALQWQAPLTLPPAAPAAPVSEPEPAASAAVSPAAPVASAAGSTSATDAPPAATADVSVETNLPAAATAPTVTPFDPNDPNTYNHTTSVTIYDSLGATHSQSLYFVKTADPTEWQVQSYIDGAAVGGAQTLQYSPPGALTSPSPGQITLPEVPVNQLSHYTGGAQALSDWGEGSLHRAVATWVPNFPGSWPGFLLDAAMHQCVVVRAVALVKTGQLARELVDVGRVVASDQVLVERLQRKFARTAACRFGGRFACARTGQAFAVLAWGA